MRRRPAQFDLRFLLLLTSWACLSLAPIAMFGDRMLLLSAILFPIGLFSLLPRDKTPPGRYECCLTPIGDGRLEVYPRGGEVTRTISVLRAFGLCVMLAITLAMGSILFLGEYDPALPWLAATMGLLTLWGAARTSQIVLDPPARTIESQHLLFGRRLATWRWRVRDTHQLAIFIDQDREREAALDTFRYQHTLVVLGRWTRCKILRCHAPGGAPLVGMTEVAEIVSKKFDLPYRGVKKTNGLLDRMERAAEQLSGGK